MKTEALRHCDACGNALSVIVYDVNVRVSIISGHAHERLQANHSAIADLQLCPNCVCGMNSHALPLAMDRRAQQLDQPNAGRSVGLSGSNVYHWPHPTVKGTTA